MPTCRNSRTTSRNAGTQTPVQAARQTLSAEAEPMRIYSNPITTTAAPTADQAACADLTGILEQLACQSQLLVDLLAAVNSLTAATLSLKSRG